MGVAVCSPYHTRDADRFAERYDVPVWVPEWMDRAPDRVEAPLERYDGELGSSGFEIRDASILPGSSEAVAYREADGTLYVPDTLGTYVEPGRIELALPLRLGPPTDVFADLTPDRVFFGHGEGVFEDAPVALERALLKPRRGFPRACLENGWVQLRAALGALR